MTDEPKLLPCPFCGGPATVATCEDDDGWPPVFNVGCDNRHCLVRPNVDADDREPAIRIWNTRAP